MSENEPDNNLEAFRSYIEEEIDNLFGTPEMLDTVRPIDPWCMRLEKPMEELNLGEKKIIEQAIFKTAGLEPQTLEESKIRQYEAHGKEGTKGAGKIYIEVFRTNQEEVFLQKLTYPDGEIRWAVGPDENLKEL